MTARLTRRPGGAARLRALLDSGRTIVAPGAFDALSARLVEGAGFPAVYMTGFGTSAALIGRPDVGLLTMTEMAGAALPSVQMAQDKAYTAAGFGMSTDAWHDFVKDDPPLAMGAAPGIDRLIVFGGGYPVKPGDAVVGGIGISGGITPGTWKSPGPACRPSRPRDPRRQEGGAMAGQDAASPGTPMLTVALDLPSAQILADQAAIIQDLQFVMDCCKRLLTELGKPEVVRDPVVPQALWSAALVAYARCFGKGKRFGLAAEDVRTLPLQGEVMRYHQWVLAERDNLTRHPANPFDEAKVGAALSPPEQDNRKVEGIAILSARHVLVDDTGVRQLGGLASELAKQTAGRAQRQQDAVLADAQQLSLDKLYQRPPLRTGPPGPGDGQDTEQAAP